MVLENKETQSSRGGNSCTCGDGFEGMQSDLERRKPKRNPKVGELSLLLAFRALTSFTALLVRSWVVIYSAK